TTATTAVTSPASAVCLMSSGASTAPAPAAAAAPAIAPRTTPNPPRGTCGASLGYGSTTSPRRATVTAPPAATSSATMDWLPPGCRVSTTSVANATTPRTTASVEPSDSVARTRPAWRLSCPSTPARNPPAVTYASGASDAGRTHSAAASAASAAASPTAATTRGAGGRLATVQAPTYSTCTPSTTTAYPSRVACAPNTSPTV